MSEDQPPLAQQALPRRAVAKRQSPVAGSDRAVGKVERPTGERP